MRSILFISVFVNLLLVAGLLAARVDDSRSALLEHLPAVGVETSGSDLKPQDVPANASELKNRLERAGLSRDLIKTLMLGWLQASLVSGTSSPEPYWEAGYAPNVSALNRQLRANLDLQEALFDLFGADSKSDPAFDSIFRPMGPEYRFLGAAEQLALQQERIESLTRSRPGGSPGRDSCIRSGVASGSGGQPVVSPMPGSRLSSASRREYELRFSPLAEQIRASGLAVSEAEFREIFSLAQSLERNPAPGSQAATRRQLRELMGDIAFDRFWSLRDPFFGAVSGALSAEGFSDDQILAAYQVVNRSQEAMLAAVDAAAEPAEAMSRFTGIRQEQTTRLGSLLGDRGAERVSAAITRAAMEFTTQGGEQCGQVR